MRVKGRESDGRLVIGPGYRGGEERRVRTCSCGEFPHGLHETREGAIEAAVKASQGGKLGGDRAIEVLLVNEPSGQSLFERRRRPVPESQTCYACDRPATLLCDGIRYAGRKPNTDPVSCDRPMCPEHAHRAGHMHVKRSRRDGGSYWTTLDYCGDCHQKARGPP